VKLRPIFVGTLVALGVAAQLVAAATYDIPLKLTGARFVCIRTAR